MTGQEKIEATLKGLTVIDEDAGGMILTLASVAMALESADGFREDLGRNQASGELDKFVVALTRWIGWHRSDGRRLVVVELPAPQPSADAALWAGQMRALPAGTKLHLLDEAIAASENPESPL